MQSDNTADLSTALAKAQGQMQAAKFNKVNPHFKNKYADLAAINDAIRKPFSDNGLGYTQTTEIREGGFVLVTTLRHGAQWVASEYPLPIGAKPQELGSALTYARRYSLAAIAGLASEEDDDAEGARSTDQTSSTPKPSAVKPAKIEPPVDPKTGEVSPHVITAPDSMTWGGLMVAAVQAAKSAAEVDEWLIKNQAGMDALEGSAPKVHERVIDRIATKHASFEWRAAE